MARDGSVPEMLPNGREIASLWAVLDFVAMHFVALDLGYCLFGARSSGRINLTCMAELCILSVLATHMVICVRSCATKQLVCSCHGARSIHAYVNQVSLDDVRDTPWLRVPFILSLVLLFLGFVVFMAMMLTGGGHTSIYSQLSLFNFCYVYFYTAANCWICKWYKRYVPQLNNRTRRRTSHVYPGQSISTRETAVAPTQQLVVVDLTALRSELFDDEKDLECCICSDNLADSSLITRLECNHAYHEMCVMKWLLTNDSCPVCRATVDFVYSSTRSDLGV